MKRAMVVGAVVIATGASCTSGDERAGAPVAASPASPAGFSDRLGAELAHSATGSAGSAVASGSGSASGFSDRLGAELARPAGTGGPTVGRSVPARPSGASGVGSGAAQPVVGAAAERGGADPALRVPPELAAIKLTLLPGWTRDTTEPGTISIETSARGAAKPARFTFHYGYDDPRAPADREAYKKFLGEARILRVTSDRQRGAAWLLLGDDARGRASFRVLVSYGGKRLVCYGSLYKRSPLADTRDELVLQAQNICESLAL